MIQKLRLTTWQALLASIGVCLLVVVGGGTAQAITQLPTPDPEPGSYGIEATKKQAAPTVGATISTPGNGASFTKSPITVTGICPKGLLIELYDNGVMVGAVMCTNGSFSVKVSLFAGTNELTAVVYDDLGQTGPTSNKVKVKYTDTHFTSFADQITLTSSYGRRSAPAGSSLSWPLQLSGGVGPYAFSIDWGDGSTPQLMSQAVTGVVTIKHTYAKAGIYQVNISVTDKNGTTAFLQVIAVASGKVDSTTSTSTGSTTTIAGKAKIMWIPYIILLILLLPTYWLGRRSMLVSIKNKMLRERDAYEQKK